MNNFDENKEFTKRAAPEGNGQQSPLGSVRRPGTSQSGAPARPPQGINGAPAQSRRPIQGAQPPKGTRPPIRNPYNVSGSAPQRPAQPQRQAPQGARPASAVNPNVRRAAPQNIPPRMQRIAPDPTPSPENMAPEKQKAGAGTIIKNILLFLAMLVGILALSFVLLLSSLHVTPEKADTSFKYDMEGEKLASLTVNRVLYMNLSKLSEICAFTESGTKVSLRFTAYNEEYVEFTAGSNSAKINGDIVSMEGAALVRENDSVWIPLSFAETYFVGLEITRDEKEHLINISRAVIGEDENEEPIYSNITFSVKGSQTIGGIEEDPDVGDVVPVEFINDLSEYEQYMNPADRDAYLILVNKTTHISADYLPENLVSITDVRRDGRKEQMVECAEKALQAMFIELRSAGYTDVSVTSGYRSYNKQSSLFNTYLQREMAKGYSEEAAKEIVLTYSAFPGTSEHQTGLCCDMHNLSSADVAFAKKEAYTWLKDNCHKFGFVIRFPEDKVDITGYSFEPWHYRFVGRYHATRMYNLGMCLEEYTEYLQMADNN